MDTLLAIRELHRRYGHIQEVIVQNFRAKPGIPMRNWPEPDARRNVAHRRRGPLAHAGHEYSGATKSFRSLLRRSARRWHQRLGRNFATDAGFHQSRKALAASGSNCRSRTEAKGFILRQRLPVYPEFLPAVTARPGLLSEKLKAAADRDGYARRRGRHDRRAHRRHGWRQICRWTSPGRFRQRTHHHRQHRRRSRMVGPVRFSRSRLHHLRSRRTCSAKNAAGA